MPEVITPFGTIFEIFRRFPRSRPDQSKDPRTIGPTCADLAGLTQQEREAVGLGALCPVAPLPPTGGTVPTQAFAPGPTSLPPGVIRIFEPSAKDIAKAGRFSLGRIALGGGFGTAIIIAAEILSEIAKRKQLGSMEAIIQQQNAEIRAAQKKRERDRRLQEAAQRGARARIELPTIPELPQTRPARPQVSPAIPKPAPVQVPEFPAPLPLPQPKPVIRPTTLPVPTPTPLPAPAPSPTRVPRPSPTRRPLPFPSPFGLPFPLSFPLPFPTPRAPVLTPVSVPRVPSPELPTPSQFVDPKIFTTVPQPTRTPTRTPTRRCEEVKRRRKRKGKCREGFFREFPDRTQFITWRTRKCL